MNDNLMTVREAHSKQVSGYVFIDILSRRVIQRIEAVEGKYTLWFNQRSKRLADGDTLVRFRRIEQGVR